MADEQGRAGGRARATLEKLGDIRLTSKVSINLRILLEPIGFLRIVLIFLCLLAFSLTAGFGSNGDSNQAFCDTASNQTVTITLSFSYPYRANSFTFTYMPPLNDTSSFCTGGNELKAFSGSAEYYVFMSVVTFLYGILAVVVYIIFYVPRYDIAKYLSVVDLICTAVLVFFFLLADIAWSAGSMQLENYSTELLNTRRTECAACPDSGNPPPKTQNFAQPSVSLLFGWVAVLLLFASIWFVYKDTIIHLSRMGPLYKLSFIQRRYRGKGGEEGTAPEPEASMSQVEGEKREEEGVSDENKW